MMEFDTWRNLVVVSVNDILSDIGKVSDSAKHSPLLTGLDFITDALRQFPDMFVPQSGACTQGSQVNTTLENSASGSSCHESKDVLHDSEPYSLTCWVTSHLLRILAVSDGCVIHTKTCEVLLRILQTTSTHNPHAFRSLAAEFIALLADLCKIHDNFFDGSSAEKVFQITKFSSPLECFRTEANELILTKRPLVISSLQSCQQLQTSVTKILQDVHMELHLSAFDHISFVDNSNDCCILWSVVVCQLEFGNVQLKTASLRLTSKLLVLSIPPAAALDYFINCLSALANMLCSGFTDCEGDFSELEEALAENIETMQDLLQGDSLQPHFNLLYHYVYEVFTSNGIMLSVAKHGTARLQTVSLCSALCRSMANVVRNVGYQADVHFDIVQSLVSETGMHRAFYGLSAVVIMHEIIHFELMGCAVPPHFYHKNVAGNPAVIVKGVNEVSESVAVQDGICQPSSGGTSVMVSERSTVAALLYQRFVALLESLSVNETAHFACLRGISVVTEVLARCTASYRQVLHTQGCESHTFVEFFDVVLMNHMISAWINYLRQECSADLPDVYSISAGYHAIVNAVGSLLFVHDLGKTVSDILPQLLEVLSLPWLISEVSWLDLKTTSDVRHLTAISKVISDTIEVTVIADVLKLLCIIPRHVAPRWRKHIICQSASDSRDVIRAIAVSNLPTMLHILGPSSYHLLTDVLLEVLPFLSTDVKQTVAGITGRIACVLSATSTLLRSSLPKTCHCVSEALLLDCSFCRLSAESKKSFSVTSCEYASMLVPLVTALSTADDRNIKVQLVSSFSQLFQHAWYWQNVGTVTDLVNLALAMHQDVDSEVRVAFYSNIKHLIPPPDAKISSRMNALPIEKMAVECRTCTTVNEMVLSSIGEIATLAENDLLLSCIIALLNEVLFPTFPLLEAVARQQMKQLSHSRNTSLPQLYMKFGKEISYSIVHCLHTTKSAKPSLDSAQVLQKVADVFSFEDVQSYLKATEHLLIPYIVRKASPTASLLMKTISRLMDDPNHKNVIVRTIGHVFCHIVCSCDGPEETQKVFSYIESEMELTLTRLLRLGNHIDSLLLMHLSMYHGQVLSGLKSLLQAKGSFEGMDISLITNEQLASLLQPNLLGILVYFDKHLKDGTLPIGDKRQAYKSLIQLMRLMGPQHITTVRMHIMTTLRIGLQFQDRQFTELCCEAWNCFVRLLDVNVLGPMLSQIVANLLPLLKTEPVKVSEIFEFLIVDNKEVLKQHLHELYFLPDTFELQRINSVLRPFVDAVYSSGDLQLQIEYLIKGISHELLDIRHMALSKLIHSLQVNKDVLHSLVLSSETAHPIISQLVTVLLSGCREPDPTTRGLIGKCLGEIGAVDPGRLELVANQPKEELPKFISCMVDDGFAFELINELAKAFLGAEDRTAQDCVAYALQELIRIYNICTELNEPSNSRSSNNGSGRLWQRFNIDIQEILTPLAQSRYMLNFVSNSSTLIYPIYRSRKGANFESWVCTLTSYLGTKLEHDVSRRVFEACRGVVKQGGDSNIAVHILPHVAAQVILDGNEEARSKLLQEILAVLNDIKEPNSRTGQLTDLRHMSAQTVFSLLDHLTRWLRHRQTVLSLQSPSTSSTASSGKGTTRASNNSASDCNMSVVDSDKDYSTVKTFLDCIPQDVLALASYNCGAYMRAFMHHELHIRSYTASGMPRNAPESLDFLLKLYVAVDEPDGVAGIIAVQNVPLSLEQQILAFESVGRLSDASVCYEHAIRSQPDNIVFRRGLLCNQLALGELNSALNLASGMISDHPSWSLELNACRIESAWRLGQWEKLQQYVSTETTTVTWNTGLGKLLLAAKVKDEPAFCNQLNVLRLEEMAPLSAASMETGSYQRGYEHIVRLHMLNELEEGLRCLLNFEPAYRKACFINTTDGSQMGLSTLSRHWQARLQYCQVSYRYQDPILNLRRIILQLASAERGLCVVTEVGQCWLQSARVARECGLLQTAQSSLLSAADFHLPEFHLEKAQWLWDRGDHDRAQSCLEKAAEEIFPDRASRFKSVPVSASVSEAEQAARLTCARMLLQLGRYCDETASCESNAVVRQLKEVTQVHAEWEDGFFYVATYYDKVMMAVVDRPEKRGDFITQVVQFFGQSLQYGSQHIYQSMPRMLTLWLDYGAEVVASESTGEKSSTSEALRQGMRSALDKLNKQMAVISEKLAPYQFLIALPQLVSRICHAHADVFAQLRSILAALLCEFPQQCVWTMMSVSKSSYTVRVRRCQEIFALGRTRKQELVQFLADMTRLVDRLLELCNRTVEGGNAATTLSIAQHFKPLQRLVDDAHRSAILLPLQSQMTPTLPAMPVPPASHVPFAATSAVFLAGIEDTVDVLASLQRPKKVTLRGSDGRRYAMLCKPKDDLRKDARLMEFNGIVNRCLLRDAESRRRALHIRTFSVTALNEECGLLEWVPNTNGLRPILLKLYRKLGLYMSGKELKLLQLPPNAPLDKKLTTYRTKLLPRHPPVFGDWFLQTFPDPTSWYNARLAYCRTAAVMSMVGYVLGLGDRHGENILLDSTTGDCVHVDFNCLFNKGETFDYPEIVPFRLTHNMVEAMGPLGAEGIFRRSCEVTLRVMRDQMDPLMSVLKTFIYDPLVEWSKPPKGRNSAAAESGEIRNEKAQTHVNNIEDRLRGILKSKTKPRGLPLSVEGHVSHLIREATDENNLCQMYIGWAAYM